MEHEFISNPQTAVVQTVRGKVRGYVWDGIYVFKGIPYAKAARFHAPEPVEEWEGVLDATSFGWVCPLLELPKPMGELMVPHRYWPMNEDCQNLNVWTPGLDDKKRPVLVWFHGGGFEAGSAIEHIAYEGENMSREGDAVVVTVNHRLNILGYFDLSDYGEEYANSGNAGTDDLIASLKWVQKNIAAFGGDPDNVTIFGQSGGGAKVTTLLQTPAADGLYAKGLNMSGVVGGLLADCTGSGKDLAEAVMAELHIKTAKELETVPYDAMAAAYKKVKPDLLAAGKNVGCKPFRNAYYLGDPLAVGFRKETAGIPLLVGTVYSEFASFMPHDYERAALTEEEGAGIVEETAGGEIAELLLPLFKEAYPERGAADLLSIDLVFRVAGQPYVRERSALNACTYAYLFNYDLPVDGGREPWHCSDIPFVFHNTSLVPVTQEKGVTERLEGEIFESLMAFARTGNPNNGRIPQWPASTPETENTMVFGKETGLRPNHDRALLPLAAEKLGPVMAELAKKRMAQIQH